MSFSIDRYKAESKKLDVTGVEWDKIRDYPLSKGDLYCLHYMMDIENHTSLYLSHLLVTRACMNPILTAFLSCWVYEELWHGEYLGRFLNEYGIEFDADERIATIRSGLGFQNSVSILTTMVGSWVMEDFAAVYLTIGAINELSTATGYKQLAQKSQHPVLQDLLARIQKDERRHFAFYYNSAKEWLTDNSRAQRIARLILDKTFVVVGKGVKTQEQVDAIAMYLFGGEGDDEVVAGIDEKISRLPGYEGLDVMGRELRKAKARAAKEPGYATRVIENEEWAVATDKLFKGALTGRTFRDPLYMEPDGAVAVAMAE